MSMNAVPAACALSADRRSQTNRWRSAQSAGAGFTAWLNPRVSFFRGKGFYVTDHSKAKSCTTVPAAPHDKKGAAKAQTKPTGAVSLVRTMR
jgi:hypothetical protein